MDIPQSDSIAGFLYASRNLEKLIGSICMKFTLPTEKRKASPSQIKITLLLIKV